MGWTNSHEHPVLLLCVLSRKSCTNMMQNERSYLTKSCNAFVSKWFPWPSSLSCKYDFNVEFTFRSSILSSLGRSSRNYPWPCTATINLLLLVDAALSLNMNREWNKHSWYRTARCTDCFLVGQTQVVTIIRNKTWFPKHFEDHQNGIQRSSKTWWKQRLKKHLCLHTALPARLLTPKPVV